MKNEYADKISELFLKNKVMDFAAVQALFPNRSRSSLLRDLKALQYMTSYNSAGCYYTLPGIPIFDSDGIWRHNGAYFSSHGSLKNTAKQLVDKSLDGRTHDELRGKLGVRVQNTLLDLVASEAIAREKHNAAYLYVSVESDARKKQLSKRMEATALQVNPYITIEVLRAVIKHPGLQAPAIQGILAKGGSGISAGQVEAVFHAYDLEKKTLHTAD